MSVTAVVVMADFKGMAYVCGLVWRDLPNHVMRALTLPRARSAMNTACQGAGSAVCSCYSPGCVLHTCRACCPAP